MRLARFIRPTSTTAKIFQKLLLPFFLIVVFAQCTVLFFWFEPSARTSADSVTVSCSDAGRIVITSNAWPRSNPYWQPSSFLNINLGFGNFSFASAKMIDIFWDLFIGRGMQVLLCLFAYPVLRRSLIGHMEQTPMHIRTYASIVFDQLSIKTLKALFQEIYTSLKRSKPVQHESALDAKPSSLKWRHLCFCLILVYILLFPTLVAAMTGYQALFRPYVKLPNQISPVEISDLKIPSLVVRDGSRIGLHDNYPVFKNDRRYEAFLDYANLLRNMWLLIHINMESSHNCYVAKPLSPDASHTASDAQSDKRCPLTYEDLAHYPAQFTLGYIDFGAASYVIPGRPLDILSQTGTLHGSDFPSIQYVSVENTALNLHDIQKSGVCQQSQRYIWGFSSILLFVFCVLTLVFATVLAALHYEPFWTTLESQTQYEFNIYRDAVDFACALESQALGGILRNMPARTLKKRLESTKSNITIQTSELPLFAKDK